MLPHPPTTTDCRLLILFYPGLLLHNDSVSSKSLGSLHWNENTPTYAYHWESHHITEKRAYSCTLKTRATPNAVRKPLRCVLTRLFRTGEPDRKRNEVFQQVREFFARPPMCMFLWCHTNDDACVSPAPKSNKQQNHWLVDSDPKPIEPP